MSPTLTFSTNSLPNWLDTFPLLRYNTRMKNPTPNEPNWSDLQADIEADQHEFYCRLQEIEPIAWTALWNLDHYTQSS